MKALDTYRDISITTQNKGRLIVLLYDGAIKFLKLALKGLDENNMETKGLYINKALAIISELNNVLDMEVGGEIASNLRSLYIFMIHHLNEANIKKDPKRIDEVIKLLEELNRGWKGIT